MNSDHHICAVEPRYPLVRRLFFPIYGRDQLVFFAGLAIVVIMLFAALDNRLALYVAVGGYAGAVLTMEVTTPSILRLPAELEVRVVELLDGAELLRRTTDNQWISIRGRLFRWDSDTICLARNPDGLIVTGGHRDLEVIAANFCD